MFSHQEATASSYLTLHTSSNHSISATEDHYLWAIRRGSAAIKISCARDLVTGDSLLVLNEHEAANNTALQSDVIVAITCSQQLGLFNPHTMSGSIIVNQIAALTFTRTIAPSIALHRALMQPVQILHYLLPDPAIAVLNKAAVYCYFAIMSAITALAHELEGPVQQFMVPVLSIAV